MEIVSTGILLVLALYGMVMLVNAIAKEEERRHAESEMAWVNNR